MNGDNGNWSAGQLVRAAMFAGTKETDCSTWESDSSTADWSEGQFESAAIPVLGAEADSVEAPPVTTTEAIDADQALAAKRDRISHVLDLLAQMRSSSRPEEFALASRGYRAEVEQLQNEVLDYLTRPAGTAG
jgi:hypothetical protein